MSGESDYDKMCQVFTEFEKNPQAFSQEPAQQAYEIAVKVEKVLSDRGAIMAWKAIATADKGQKYQLMEQAALESTKKKWSCPAMKKYFQSP